jgi:hypothetical protein
MRPHSDFSPASGPAAPGAGRGRSRPSISCSVDPSRMRYWLTSSRACRSCRERSGRYLRELQQAADGRGWMSVQRHSTTNGVGMAPSLCATIASFLPYAILVSWYHATGRQPWRPLPSGRL